MNSNTPVINICVITEKQTPAYQELFNFKSTVEAWRGQRSFLK